jgi:tRNA 5-methylaminomethyl-2-thiouridine biosynthesis bifunctional protein
LAERNCNVTLLEREEIANGASGNPAAVLYPQLATQPESPLLGWSLNAYALMQRRLPLLVSPMEYAQPGMLKTPKDAKEETRLRTACAQLAPEIVRYVERAEASTLLGVAIPRGGAWFPQGTWVRPKALCHALLSHPGITVRNGVAVATIETQTSGIRITDTQKRVWEADAVVLANGLEAAVFAPEWQTRLRPSAGQISQVPLPHIAQMPRAILCHRGYIIPGADKALIGATYERNSLSTEVTEAAHLANAVEAECALPGFFAQQNPSEWEGRVSLRATSFDHMPVAGELKPRIWITAGHGSRGMLSAPLAAEMLAAQMMGDIVPMARSLISALDSRR